MKVSKFELSITALAILSLLAVAIISIVGGRSPPVQQAEGGTYAGQLPGFGQVEIELFMGDSDATGWLNREGFGLENYLSVSAVSNRLLRVEVIAAHANRTNAIIEFQLMNSGCLLSGVITLPDARPQPFALTRITRHLVVRRSSGLLFGRFGAYADYCGEFPSIKMDSSFHNALYLKLAGETKAAARRFTTGDIARELRILRDGEPMSKGHIVQQAQVRLLTDALASFAVWNYPEYGGCGDPTFWEGRNFQWQNGKLHEFKLLDMFRPESGWQKEIRKLCGEELMRHDAEGPAADVLDSDTDISVFTLSPTGLQIYFNPYKIDGGAAGAYVIRIPYAQLKSFLKPGFLPLDDDRVKVALK